MWKKKFLIILKLIIVFFVSITLVFGIPIFINEVYKASEGYTTLWGASDVLAYYAVILSGIITILVLIATIHHNKEMCDKQLHSYKTQSKVPFYVVKDVVCENGDLFTSSLDNSWTHSFHHNKDGFVINPTIIISLENIGDLTIGKPNCKSYNEAIESYSQSNHTNININYNIQHCIDKHWNPRNTNYNIIINDIIYLEYKNIFGVEFKQNLIIEYTLIYNSNNVNIKVNDTNIVEV